MKNRSGSLKKEGATAGFERVFQKNSDSAFLPRDSFSSAEKVFSIIREKKRDSGTHTAIRIAVNLAPISEISYNKRGIFAVDHTPRKNKTYASFAFFFIRGIAMGKAI